MNIIGIIPARMSSSRLPNKPMADILGMPMIGHVYYRSKMNSILNEVYVATCDKEIFDYVISIGGKAIMTADTHERASDRTAEALLTIEKETGNKVDIVVMIQGDEPMITPEMISAAVTPLLDEPELNITNLMEYMATVEEHEDPAEVKVVVNKLQNAIYFSREPIPSRKKGVSNVPMLKQVCIIPFRRDFLIEYNGMEQTPLEIIESVDMNRLIENNITIRMVLRDEETFSVDTQSDLDRVNRLMSVDELTKRYLKQ
ncbi:MAG: 3-deoxy-manno-octulosonate cytidylyltransferase [Hydrotalea sp.]|nr:3-deoxy-manno-octulosonate cytidylyltransferase [Hydrotalea sp.]